VLVDDRSRISRDIADAIRVMQRLKFWDIRVLYLSQGIDSDSEQAESLVAVHGLVDSLYLRELAKKVIRGLAGRHAASRPARDVWQSHRAGARPVRQTRR
jgi:site-specific DNA recombinase